MSFILGWVNDTPGRSAEAGYRAARADRRRRLVAGWLLVMVGIALVGAAMVGMAMATGGPRAGSGTGVGAGVWAAGRQAGVLVGAGCLVVLVGAVWLRRVRQDDPTRWLRGATGERLTAQHLESLSRRWVVRHDLAVPGSRANVDHLVVGPTGIWLIDTKTTRASVRSSLFGRVYFGARMLDTGPVRWEAETVAAHLGVPVRPLVAVVGQGLRRRGGKAGGVRVVPVEVLRRRLEKGRRRLTRAEVSDLATTIEETFRTRTVSGV